MQYKSRYFNIVNIKNYYILLSHHKQLNSDTKDFYLN